MDCAAHPGTEASGPCAVCFQNLCDACAAFERDGGPCCERCGRAAEEEQNALSSGLLALIAVGYLATLVLGTVLLKARPIVGGLAAVVAIALGRALQILVKAPAVSRRTPGAPLPVPARQD
jgi:hypothetical protein